MTSVSLNYLLAISCFAVFINSAISGEYVPVYLWKSTKVNHLVPALPRVASETFREFIQESLAKDTIVVAFAEPNLSPEDFGSITESGEKVLLQLSELRSETSTAYLPSVQEPINVIEKLFSDDITKVPAKDFNIDSIKTSAVIVDLSDAKDDEDRTTMLSRHDKVIVDIFNQISKKHVNVVAILSGYQASWVIPQEVLNRKARDTKSVPINGRDDESSWKILLEDEILIYATKVPIFTYDGAKFSFTNNDKVDSNPSENGVSVTIISPNVTANINITIAFGYWKLSGIEITVNRETVNLRIPTIQPPDSFSYQCTKQVFYASNMIDKWELENFQIQPLKGRNSSFGDPYYCVGFTSAPIWSGLFITFILATIMAVGLMMMLDMKTMDRFDDPKGKTIIVNVSE